MTVLVITVTKPWEYLSVHTKAPGLIQKLSTFLLSHRQYI